jgi:hypothetical protein
MTRVAEGLREEQSSFVSFPAARTENAGQAKSKPAKPSRKVCLLVLGMHGSGVTAFGRVLNLLGCDLPPSVVPATDAIEGVTEGATGETDAIRQLNDRILASAGTRWDDWVEFHPGWLQSPRAAEFHDEALALLRQEFKASRLFVLNDPRMCRLVPFWLGVLEAAGVQPLIVSPVRSPLAVAAALQERDGFSPGLGHLMWLRHVLDAEFASRDTKRFFTSYDQLASGWARTTTAASSALGIAWPRLSDKAAAEIESYLSNDSRDDRQQVANGLDNPTLSDWLRTTSEILSRWAVEGESPQDHARLDDIRLAMNTAAPAFSRLLESERARTVRLETELASEHQQAAQLKSELEAAEDSLAELRHRLAQTESALAQRSHETEQTAGELAAARASRAEAEAARIQAEKVSVGLKQHLDVLLADVKQRQAHAAEQADADASLARQVKQVLAVLDTQRHELAEQARAAQAAELHRQQSEAERLRRVAALEIARAAGLINHSGASTVRRRWHFIWLAARLKRSGLFDAEWYRRYNTDVADSGIDPLRHYVQFGAREGRAPNPGLLAPNGKP